MLLASPGHILTCALLPCHRTYTVVFGATLLPFGLIPSFRKMRVILIVGVLGTIYTGCYGMYVASTHGFKNAAQAQVVPPGATTSDRLFSFFLGTR